jgi:hypothetical protein
MQVCMPQPDVCVVCICTFSSTVLVSLSTTSLVSCHQHEKSSAEALRSPSQPIRCLDPNASWEPCCNLPRQRVRLPE